MSVTRPSPIRVKRYLGLDIQLTYLSSVEHRRAAQPGNVLLHSPTREVRITGISEADFLASRNLAPASRTTIMIGLLVVLSPSSASRQQYGAWLIVATSSAGTFKTSASSAFREGVRCAPKFLLPPVRMLLMANATDRIVPADVLPRSVYPGPCQAAGRSRSVEKRRRHV